MYFNSIQAFLKTMKVETNFLYNLKLIIETSQNMSFESLIFNNWDFHFGRINFSQYLTQNERNKMFENHRKVCDLHIVLDGEEYFYYYHLGNYLMPNYSEHNDISLFNDETCLKNYARLTKGYVILADPWDAHMAGISPHFQGQNKIKKMVIKFPLQYMEEFYAAQAF